VRPIYPHLRWLTLLLPAAFVATLEVVTVSVLAPRTDTWVAALVGVVAAVVGILLFSLTALKIFETVQQRLLRRYRELSALNAVGAVLTESLELEEMMGRALEKVLEVTRTRAGVVFVQDESGAMVPFGGRGAGYEALLGLGGGMLEEAADSVVLRTPREAANVVAAAVEAAGLAFFMVIPLKAKGRALGMMAIASDEERQLDEGEKNLLTAIGTAVGMAVENSNLYEAARRRSEQLAALNDAGMSLASELSLAAVLQKVVDLSRNVVQARYGALGVLDAEGQIGEFVTSGITAHERARIGQPPRGKGLLGLMMREGKPLRIVDIASDPRSAGFPPHHPDMRSLLGVPIIYKGRTIGDLYLTDKHGSEEFSQEDQDALSLFAAQAAIAIENARLYDEERRRAQEWKSLFELGEQVASSLDLEALLTTVVERARDLLNADNAMLSLISPAGDELVVRASVGLQTEAMRNLHWHVDDFIKGGVEAAEVPVIVRSYPDDPQVSQPPLAAAIEEGVGSFVAARFEAKGKVLGVLNVGNLRPTPFTQRDGELLQSFANLAAIAVENASLYEKTQDLAVLEERQRIGMELHDGVIQSIYAVGLNLEDCAEEVHANPTEVRSRLDKGISDLNRVIQEIRAYIYDLRPGVVSRGGVSEALRELLREVKVNTLMETELAVEGEMPVLSEEQSTNLIRIAQEALTNVKKHAQASAVRARLHTEDGLLRLTIADNGQGFDPDQPMTPAQQGLRNMSERARALGGNLCVESADGKGTSLEVTVPLSEAGQG
jgi:two-component system sensor histidine kinase DevS